MTTTARLTPSQRAPEFEERTPLGHDLERADIFNVNVDVRILAIIFMQVE